MTTRTTKKTVTFTRPFSLSGFDGEQPAGSYSVETDEELLEGVSFPAYRRMATMMQLDAASRGAGGVLQVAVIDPQQLEAALAVDAAHNAAYDEFAAWRALNAPGTVDLKS
ncbi:MAG TPA: hypothetical protein VGQ35_14100 [Dongiaceae bacterium]|jgi:hypothetical protein|nr:hypothetical protein [Dongiaceae bacterium]